MCYFRVRQKDSHGRYTGEKQAREGIFPESIADDVSPERLKRFFKREDQVYQVKKEVREAVLFAVHNVLRDPPFSKLDFISCRNLLIYLNQDMQKLAMELFHFALKPQGYLFLGASESAYSESGIFTPVDKKHRVFKRGTVASARPYLPLMFSTGWRIAKTPDAPRVDPKTVSYGDLHRQILEQYAPPSALVNSEYEILHLSETAGRFLRFGGGEPSRNLLKVAHPELRLDLHAALLAASRERQPTEMRRVRIRLEGAPQLVNIRVQPAGRPESNNGFLLVIFEVIEPLGADGPDANARLIESGGSETKLVMSLLEEELQQTKDQLRATVEQYEVSTEYMKASNEELQAINEELETSKEELQSLNEELRAVNYELKEKIDELGRTNIDIQNLLSATDIGTIFLDRELSIKRYTPSAHQLFNIIPSDIEPAHPRSATGMERSSPVWSRFTTSQSRSA